MDNTEREKVAGTSDFDALGKLRMHLDNISEVLILQDVRSGRIEYISSNYERMFNQKVEEIAENPLLFLSRLHPGDRSRLEALFHEQIGEGARGNGYAVEYRIVPMEGQVKWISSKAYPVKNDRGDTVQLAIILSEISSLKEALEAKQVLIREMNHRIKNNLSLLASITRLKASTLRDEEMIRILKEFETRINVFSSMHDELSLSDDIDWLDGRSYFSGLLEELAESHRETHRFVRFEASIEIGEVRTDKAIPLALILTELLTNAYKYAFSSENKDAMVEIRLSGKPDLTLTYRDNGRGFDYEAAKRKGSLGLLIIESLARQLGAVLRVASNAEGTRVELSPAAPRGQ